MINTRDKIRSFLKLPIGWHYSSGRPPTRQRAVTATAINDCLFMFGFSKTNAFAGIDGEIMVAGYSENRCVEITIELDGSLRFCHKDGLNELDYQENLPIQDVFTLLETLSEAYLLRWNLSDLSTQDTTSISIETNLKISHSARNEILQTFSASPVLKNPVRSAHLNPFVNTLRSSTPKYLPTRQYTGSLTNPTYQTAAA